MTEVLEASTGLTVLSCFSGVGGLDLGLEAAGFDTVGCLETDTDARAALALNRPDWPLLEPHDVVEAGRSVSPESLGLLPRELTLIAGGPPCQSFSKAAQWMAPKTGINDARGTTVGGLLRLVESFLPSAVLMENVAGFVSGRFNAREIIEDAFGEINRANGTCYRLHSWVVNAADYGVPQHRRRAIVIAFRDSSVVPDLPATHETDHRTAWDALGDHQPAAVPVATGKYAELLPCIPEGSNYQYLTASGAGPDKELFGYRTKFWSFLLKLAKDQPSWTLPASPGPATGPFHWDNRPLTAHERMLLQGFPETWRLPYGERVGVRLAGNATPPPLAEALGRFVVAQLASPLSLVSRESIRPTLATQSRGAPPEPRPPRPIPDAWVGAVGPKPAHPGAGAGPAAHLTKPELVPDPSPSLASQH